MLTTRALPRRLLVRNINTTSSKFRAPRQLLRTSPLRLQTHFVAQNARNSALTYLRREEIRPSANILGTAPWTLANQLDCKSPWSSRTDDHAISYVRKISRTHILSSLWSVVSLLYQLKLYLYDRVSFVSAFVQDHIGVQTANHELRNHAPQHTSQVKNASWNIDAARTTALNRLESLLYLHRTEDFSLDSP